MEVTTTPEKTDLARFGTIADAASKGVAAFVIAVYASGFLIVSLYHFKYGFIITDPFRPRIISAGIWFFAFMAIPMTVAFANRNMTWLGVARNSVYFLTVAMAASNTIFSVMSNSNAAKTSWLRDGTFAFMAFVAIVLLNMKKLPAYIPAVVSVLVATYVYQDYFRRTLNQRALESEALTVWFFSIFVVTLVQLKLYSAQKISWNEEWWRILALLFPALLIFAGRYYPHIKSGWGGGTPINVTLYLTKDSVLKPGQNITAQLIEESDQGFYIAAPSETKALFIRRSDVDLIYFGDKAADSSLLRDEKK